ncbi:heavy metal ion homeostasis protein [Rhodotorula taiwanensis]|uniref:Heavy metal ion homeostasis protein n=1 Tax=Rhodotorula taiwanensis TaxID=741276 RepID=A0A2S5B3U9_9BASI|nr:heavy metal ion homeostasis protein [Rhodotorula taiwanensis]
MSSLLRFAQSAIQGANDVGSGGGYSHPAQHRHEPDLDAFADLEGDSDSDRGDDDGYTPTSIAAVSRREANLNAIASPSSSSSAAAAAAVRQQRAAPLHAHGGLPGGYDFEPQVERPRPTPLAAASARSSMSIGRSASNGALSRSRRASLSSQRFREELAGRYETASGEQYGQPAAFAVWRGLVNRLRGTAEGGGGGGAANGGNGTANGEEGHGLLFSQDDSEDPSDRDWPLGRAGDARDRNQYPPARDPHLPLPPRAPQFAPPPDVLSAGASDPPAGTSSTAAPRVVGRGQGHDGVFANLAAKPDNPNGLDIVGEGPDKEEILPPYEAAQHDPSPAYWETTVVAPSGPLGPDDILVDGMPVGNVFSFAWNLLVSMSFQFVGFLLTFILHTTHAAKNGSRAGLGITLIQLGFYLKQRSDGLSAAPGDETGLNGSLGPSESEQRWSWWNPADQPTGTLPDGSTPTATLGGGVFGSLPTQVHGALAGMLASSDGSSATPSGFPTLQGDGASLEEVQRMGEAANEWMAFVLVTIGSFLLIGSCLAYWRAVRWARAVRAGQGPGNDAESVVAI